jgi:AraC-like DNA-binding protein
MKTVEIEPPKPARQNNAGDQVESCESEAVRKIEQSITYMLRHLDESLQVATLAAQANISASHFFALFKRQTGCAPIDCFIRLRMQHACRLLDETVMSVKEVAATLGYDDPFYFSRIFKSVNHVAPSEYRLLKNGDKEAVRNCGITLRFFHPSESRTGLERNGSHPAQDPDGAKGRIGISMGISGYRNGGKCRLEFNH